MKHQLPQFGAKELCKAMIKLGFEPCKSGNHQHKYKHPTKKSLGKMPFFLFPDNLRTDKNFQKALIRDLIIDWDFKEEVVLEALK